ncbi:MAG: sialate O-acetylesterase [Kiritimatiellae bacterium]|nr:sialate O-acetylesterase [Kiritimatiellia bacterium]
MKKLMVAAAFVAVAASSFAEVKVSRFFSSNMVLQRGKPYPVIGTAAPGEKVTVQYGGASASVVADADGRFRAVLPPLEVEKTGRDLVVSGENRVVFTNVVVGDVWLVSGQSNSEMSFSWGIINGKAEMAKAKDYPNIRAIKFMHVRAPFPVKYAPCNGGSWVVATEKTLSGITAEGYFMARELNAKTGVPIGILDDNWSGCRIEPFVCAEGMKLVPELAKEYNAVMNSREAIVEWCGKVAAHRADGDYGAAGGMPGQPDWSLQYNAMISPIVAYPICGATWYQGCSNGGEGISYAKKLAALAGGWRSQWGYDFPFYIVQLASYTAKTTDPAGGNGYARIRNAMRIAAQTIPKAGLAVAIDIGNAKDIHPKNKYDVGYRLSLWARRDVYGEKDLVVSGPLFKKLEIEGGKARVIFEHTGSGLFAGEKGPDTPGVAPEATPGGKLRGFAVAGADRKWHWADAVIDGKDVVVSSAEVPAPVAVRYAHRANPMGDCNLYNKEGLPASPFRTDDW